MSEHEFSKRPALQQVKVEVTDELEVRRWCNEFDITPERFGEAVKLVGSMPMALRFYLQKRSSVTKVVTPAIEAAFETKRRELAERRLEKPARFKKRSTKRDPLEP